MRDSFGNFEIVTLALYLLGGEAASVDVEDAAIKADELAAGRFAWRKYPQRIDLKRVSTALFDARKEKNGAYVFGSDRNGWMLTERGLAFAREHVASLEHIDVARRAQSPRERQWERNERARMLADETFARFESDAKTIAVSEAEAFFRLDDYVVGRARERKLTRFLNIFGDDVQLGAAVRALAEKVKGK